MVAASANNAYRAEATGLSLYLPLDSCSGSMALEDYQRGALGGETSWAELVRILTVDRAADNPAPTRYGAAPGSVSIADVAFDGLTSDCVMTDGQLDVYVYYLPPQPPSGPAPADAGDEPPSEGAELPEGDPAIEPQCEPGATPEEEETAPESPSEPCQPPAGEPCPFGWDQAVCACVAPPFGYARLAIVDNELVLTEAYADFMVGEDYYYSWTTEPLRPQMTNVVIENAYVGSFTLNLAKDSFASPPGAEPGTVPAAIPATVAFECVLGTCEPPQE
jgi:hypothetical protein